MKKIILLVVILIAVFYGYNVISPARILNISNTIIPEYYAINLPDNIIYPKQSKNSCWPYSVSFLLNTINSWNIIDPEYVSKSISRRRTSTSITYPPWLEKYIMDSWFIPQRIVCNEENKIDCIKTALWKIKKPIILLWEYQGFQHYLVFLGYDQNNIFVYNSILKSDMNWSIIGNESFENEWFKIFWYNWWQYGLYKYYALTIKE